MEEPSGERSGGVAEACGMWTNPRSECMPVFSLFGAALWSPKRPCILVFVDSLTGTSRPAKAKVEDVRSGDGNNDDDGVQ